MSRPYALLTLEKQYHTNITTSVSAQWPIMPSKRHVNNTGTGTAAYKTKPVPTYFSITLPSKCNSSKLQLSEWRWDIVTTQLAELHWSSMF